MTLVWNSVMNGGRWYAFIPGLQSFITSGSFRSPSWSQCFLLSWEKKAVVSPILHAWVFVESCYVRSCTHKHRRKRRRLGGRCGWSCGRGVRVPASRQENMVIALYKVMSSEHVGVGHAQIYFNTLPALPVGGEMSRLPVGPTHTVTLWTKRGFYWTNSPWAIFIKSTKRGKLESSFGNMSLHDVDLCSIAVVLLMVRICWPGRFPSQVTAWRGVLDWTSGIWCCSEKPAASCLCTTSTCL